MHELNRRSFLKAAGVAATAETLLGSRTHLLGEIQSEPAPPVAANDHIQIALIGAGGQGQGDTKVALQVPGVKLLAVSDCYDGRLEHSKELVAQPWCLPGPGHRRRSERSEYDRWPQPGERVRIEFRPANGSSIRATSPPLPPPLPL